MIGANIRWDRISRFCHGAAWIVRRWPVLILAVSLVSPISPHLRLTGANETACAYGGVHGLLWEYRTRPCPLIAFIETRGRGQW